MKKGKDVDMNKYLVFSEEVNKAIKQNKPIVALESTIISHGMPYPQNVETAREVEEIVRENGATPATIAIMDGKIKIGLRSEEHTSELQSRGHLVCRLLLEKKKKKK